MVVFFSMIFVKMPPRVSMPSERGVTSRRSTSLTSPWSTAACMAAPTATTSSGFTDLLGSLPKNPLTVCWTLGVRVWPPTRSTSSTVFRSASFIAVLQGSIVRSKRSNCERVRFMRRCFGPEASAVTKGRFISVSVAVESSIFARSAPSLSLWSAILSVLRSMPFDFLNSSTIQSIMRRSKSSPPRKVSPLVALTSMTPSPISRMEISKVPPPRSYTAIFSSPFLSRPYDSAAAVGSLMMRSTFRPAIFPASLVAWRWESSKYAGTVTTASVTGSPR